MSKVDMVALAQEGAKVRYKLLLTQLRELEALFPGLKAALRYEKLVANAAKARAAKGVYQVSTPAAKRASGRKRVARRRRAVGATKEAGKG